MQGIKRITLLGRQIPAKGRKFLWQEQNFGPSGVRALPLAAGRNAVDQKSIQIA